MESLKADGFRMLAPPDAPAMAKLERVCFSLSWSESQCGSALAQKAFRAFGIWENGGLVAYISAYHARPEMEILNIAVAPERRRQGLGRRMLNLALQAAAKMGIKKISLETRESNSAAIALYESAGFAKSGRRKRYYPDNGEDALIYILNL